MTERELQQLENALRHSRRALPIEIVFAVVGGTALWVSHRCLGLPRWIGVFLGLLVVSSAVGDATNIVFIKRSLRLMERDRMRDLA